MYYLPDCVTIIKKKGSKITSQGQYTDYEKLLNEYLLNLIKNTGGEAESLRRETLKSPTKEFVGNEKINVNKLIDELPFTMKKVQEIVNERRRFYRLLLSDSPYSFYFSEVIKKIIEDDCEYKEQYIWNDVFSINFILEIEYE